MIQMAMVGALALVASSAPLSDAGASSESNSRSLLRQAAGSSSSARRAANLVAGPGHELFSERNLRLMDGFFADWIVLDANNQLIDFGEWTGDEDDECKTWGEMVNDEIKIICLNPCSTPGCVVVREPSQIYPDAWVMYCKCE
jgi:hypothetical protein